ncbi:MAG: TonB-dependent receptor [Ginsengibacter sp.]
MRQNFKCFPLLIIATAFSSLAFAQMKTIKGKITNKSSGETVPSVSVIVKGSGEGTYTNEKGAFSLNTKASFPLTLTASSIGYEEQDIMVNDASTLVNIIITPASTLGQGIVVSATRTPSRILESPVTIERISAADIRNSPAVSYYDMISKLKEVDVVTASLTFVTPSTRGFNGSGNLRLNQIVDGMDNQAPGLNFAVGSVIGLSGIDVASVELLPGASSALYGPGGMNGAIIISSKDPFRYQGLSFEAKAGMMNIDNKDREPSPYYNWALRWAKKVSDKFAFKIGGELVQAKDWVANDYRDFDRVDGKVKTGTRATDPNFDGVNIYGDETTLDIRSVVLNPLAAGVPFYAPYINSLPKSIPVSRTGYAEKDILNPNTVNFKAYAAASYKLTKNTSLNAEGYWGTGNSVYTGNDRYSLLNLKVGQYKLELVNPNWFVRAYTTQENAGETYTATTTTRLVNEAWKPSQIWYPQYTTTFLNAKIAGESDIAAHNTARATADIGRPAPGSDEFKKLFDQVRSIPIPNGGLFVDKTNLYNVEGQYDFSSITSDVIDILIGGNYKKYVLNSEGTLFADSTGKIPINEYGAYLQATRGIFDNRLKLIASARYDKNDNFEGRFTPRFSAVIKVAEDNNIRLSYQQAYRFGSTQQQWINLKAAGVRLIGGAKSFKDFYNFNSNPVYGLKDILAGNLTPVTVPEFKAETVNSFEGGYKGLLFNKRLLVDLYGYYGIYKDFITRTSVVQSVTGKPGVFTNPATLKANISNSDSITVYSVPTNVKNDVTTYGFGIGLTYAFPNNFQFGANISSDHLDNVPAGFIASFNAPDYRWGVSFSNSGFGKEDRFGFNFNYRWQDDVKFQGDFASGLVPAYQTVDGQFSYKLPAQKVLLKLGATNLLNQYYRDGFGNATIGGLYYFSIGYGLF